MAQAADDLATRLKEALRMVAGPDGADIVSGGLVDGLTVKDGLVQLALRAERSQVGTDGGGWRRNAPRCCGVSRGC